MDGYVISPVSVTAFIVSALTELDERLWVSWRHCEDICDQEFVVTKVGISIIDNISNEEEEEEEDSISKVLLVFSKHVFEWAILEQQASYPNEEEQIVA